MGSTLFDQLKKTGLIDEKKAKQVKKEKHQQKKRKKKQNTHESQSQQLAKQAQAEKAAKDRRLNRKKKAAEEQKALSAQVKQLIEENRIAEYQGEVGFNFADGTKVQRLFVTGKIQEQLVRGKAAIVKLDGHYNLVPREIAIKIRLRDPLSLVFLQTEQDKPVEDDPYAEYQVPDDLMW